MRDTQFDEAFDDGEMLLPLRGRSIRTVRKNLRRVADRRGFIVWTRTAGDTMLIAAKARRA